MNESEPTAAAPESLLDLYFQYTKETEPPSVYNRWCIISGISALLGRNFYFQHGHFTVYPNLYCVLIGDPGTRKSTAIRIIRKLITSSGYSNIAADRTSKEKFLLDLQGETEDLSDSASTGSYRRSAYDKATAENLWGDNEVDDTSAHELYATADELNEFIGTNNIDFCRMLGQLWDYEGTYRSRIKNGRSVAISNPTVGILGGITRQDFALTFPPALLGQGFISRIIIIHGEISGRKYTFPEPPTSEEREKIITKLKEMQLRIRGVATIDTEAASILDDIYKTWTEIPDMRFKHYSNRRFTQLLKLCLIYAAAKQKISFDKATVILANTTLAAAEFNMPKALGEYGKGKHSDIANKVLELIAGGTNTGRPVGMKDIWKEVHKDLDKPTDMAVIIQNLEQAEKIHAVKGISGSGWLVKKERKVVMKYVDWNLLTTEEQEMVK